MVCSQCGGKVDEGKLSVPCSSCNKEVSFSPYAIAIKGCAKPDKCRECELGEEWMFVQEDAWETASETNLEWKDKKLPVRSIGCHSNSTNAGQWKRSTVVLPAQSIFRLSNLPNSAWTVIRVGIEFSILGSTRLPIVFTLVLLASGSRACIKVIYLTSCVEWKFQSHLRRLWWLVAGLVLLGTSTYLVMKFKGKATVKWNMAMKICKSILEMVQVPCHYPAFYPNLPSILIQADSRWQGCQLETALDRPSDPTSTVWH